MDFFGELRSALDEENLLRMRQLETQALIEDNSDFLEHLRNRKECIKRKDGSFWKGFPRVVKKQFRWAHDGYSCSYDYDKNKTYKTNQPFREYLEYIFSDKIDRNELVTYFLNWTTLTLFGLSVEFKLPIIALADLGMVNLYPHFEIGAPRVVGKTSFRSIIQSIMPSYTFFDPQHLDQKNTENLQNFIFSKSYFFERRLSPKKQKLLVDILNGEPVQMKPHRGKLHSSSAWASWITDVDRIEKITNQDLLNKINLIIISVTLGEREAIEFLDDWFARNTQNAIYEIFNHMNSMAESNLRCIETPASIILNNQNLKNSWT